MPVFTCVIAFIFITHALIACRFCFRPQIEKYEHSFSVEFEDYIRNDNVGSEHFLHLLQVMEQDSITLDDIPNALAVSETK